MNKAEAYIVCEGFHDRAFWGGFLKHLRCVDPGENPGGERKKVFDPWGLEVKRRHFGYQSINGGFIRVVPALDKYQVRHEFRDRLLDRSRNGLSFLIACRDEDWIVEAGAENVQAPAATTLADMLKDLGQAERMVTQDEAEIDGGPRVFLVRWAALDAPAPGLPVKQTLERLICAALAAAKPAWAGAVHEWLVNRPDPPQPCPKEHAWSYLAGWFANCGGYEAFLQERIWADETVVAELEKRLKETGIWRVAEAIANWS